MQQNRHYPSTSVVRMEVNIAGVCVYVLMCYVNVCVYVLMCYVSVCMCAFICICGCVHICVTVCAKRGISELVYQYMYAYTFLMGTSIIYPSLCTSYVRPYVCPTSVLMNVIQP